MATTKNDSLIEPENNEKAWYESKTMWASIITAVLPLIPPVGVFAAANPEVYSLVLGGLFAALRIKTDAPVKIGRK